MAKKSIVILFPCVGRRVSLVRSFQQSCRELGYRPIIVGTETKPTSPAWQICDRRYLVQPVSHPEYVRQVMAIAKKEGADLLVPTVDLDLKIWAERREALANMGCKALIADPKMVLTCENKLLMYRFLLKHGFETPQTWSPAQFRQVKRYYFPYFLKPRDGHASRGNMKVNNREELVFYLKRISKCMVQEFIEGEEYTVDVLTDFTGKIRCVVPRRRLEVRAGEVSKGLTVKHPGIIHRCQELLAVLGSGPGITTIQCFLTKDNRIKFIEINPRFGGGIPLSIAAGANFPKWILQWWLGENPRIPLTGWRDGLMMLRYDEAIWVDHHNVK